MSNYMKKIRLCFIFSIVVLVLSIFSLGLSIVEKDGAVSISIDILSIFSLIFSSIVFGVFNSKDENFGREHKALLGTTCGISFLGSIIIGVLGFLAYYELNSRVIKSETTNTSQNGQIASNEEAQKENKIEENSSLSNGENSLGEPKSEEHNQEKTRPTAEELMKKIEALNEMKKEGQISNEEYDILKQKILDEIVK